MGNEADIQFQLGILRRDGYHAAARIIESMQCKVSREAEMRYLKEFVRQSFFDEELSRDQLRCFGRHTVSTTGLMRIRPGMTMTCLNCGTPRRKRKRERRTGAIMTALMISCANILCKAGEKSHGNIDMKT